MEEQYNPKTIEETAQHYWQDNRLFEANENSTKEKYYCLTMFPYPSGRLHMGHTRVYTINDVISRYQRMLGKNVLQPMGWDAFGLPAENAAIQNKVPPAEWTYKNITQMREQMSMLGLAYDWRRELTTCDPNYYRWEQWFFLQLYKKGLVYKKNAEVNWDPVDQTILANEQVVDGRGWRSGALVERREIPQWFFKITAYADELINDLDKLPGWPEQVKTMQRNWIGRSEGVEIDFAVTNTAEKLTVFTTRPDTLFGVTYLAIAPQHPLAKEIAENNADVNQFLEECKNIKVAEAELATLEKRGVPTGLSVTHPITKKEIPLWVANFVVMDYGTGALMAVPAHDDRDHEFAKKYDLPIVPVVVPVGEEWDFSKSAYTLPGELIHSDQFTGLNSKAAIPDILSYIENHELGIRRINFRLRDWSVSRQRYWGTPVPIINCPECGAVPVPEKDLPVVLPEKIEFTGVASPLKSMPEFYEVECPHCHKSAHRETDTFDTFFESSWYYARFASYDQKNAMLDDRANFWLPVDQYIGGVEHACMHLLYARFIHKAMRDIGLVKCDEPFTRLLNQGFVLNQGTKMSKSKGNVVDPVKLIQTFGADTVRLFMIFAAPPEQSLEWSDSGVEGSFRFLKRLWAFAYEERDVIKQAQIPQTMDWEIYDTDQRDTLREIYEILDQARFDYARMQLNTVVSGCMKLFNLIAKIPQAKDPNKDLRAYIIYQGMSMLLRLLAPIAPHITHQLWNDLGYTGIIIDAVLPEVDKSATKTDKIDLVVQINGKLRSKITVPLHADTKTIEDMATQDAKVQTTISNRTIKKIITVPGRLVNIVVGD